MASVIVLAGCGTASVVSHAAASLLLSKGTQTASLTVTETAAGAPSFTGSIDGDPLNGVLSGTTNRVNSLCTGSSTLQVQTFTYSGAFHGQHYSFNGCFSQLGAASVGGVPNPEAFLFKVRGTVGTAALTGSVTYVGRNESTQACIQAPSTCHYEFRFSGTIGSQDLSGTATVTIPGASGFVINVTLTAS